MSECSSGYDRITFHWPEHPILDRHRQHNSFYVDFNAGKFSIAIPANHHSVVSQNVRQHKIDCTKMMEDIHQILYAIAGLHIKSDTAGELSPSTLRNIGKFTE
jgi:trans-2-enoyl-CoA reductase